ncbi:MAG: sigma 54-interacting transcriptional regulator, partial [Deltaproteobacteria bacterium]|nr:sigma 54-interacting transcriptional regulator [Deltaproteobacteria bacterium]
MVKKPTYEELKKRNNELDKLSFKHKHIEELLQKKRHELQERVKELTCLYAISNLFENPGLSVEDIFKRTLNLLPTAWQYPEITCARIVLKHQVFQTTNYKKTAWRQVSDITIDDDSLGAVEVYYLEERSDIDEGPFLQEERKLINAVAEKLGKIIWLKSAEESLREAEHRYRILTEKVADGVTLLQEGRFLYANRAFTSLFEFADPTQVLGKMPDELFHCKMNQESDDFYGPFESATLGDEFFRTACIRRQGQDFWVEGHHTIIQFKGRPAILSAIRDVTEKMLRDNVAREMAAQLREENIALRSSMKERYRFGSIIGKSQPMQEVYDLIVKAANSNASVAVYGESGTGKEMIAHAIHDLSNRRDKELVTVHCGAIPELLLESEFFGHKKGAFTGAYIDKAGYLDLADGGSLFLDEVGELGHNMQVKLLRAIDGGEYTPV